MFYEIIGIVLYIVLRALFRRRIWLQDHGKILMLFGFGSNMVGKYI